MLLSLWSLRLPLLLQLSLSSLPLPFSDGLPA
jgi:hypothetical protein